MNILLIYHFRFHPQLFSSYYYTGLSLGKSVIYSATCSWQSFMTALLLHLPGNYKSKMYL